MADYYSRILNSKLNLQDPVPLLIPVTLALNSDADI